MKEVELSNGIVIRVEPVPPLAFTSIVAEMPECQVPDPPLETIKGRTGTSQVPARQGTAEYEAWKKDVDRARRAQERIRIEAYYTLSVLAWKLPGEDDFSEEVPDGWEIPSRLTRAGLKPNEGPDGKRWDYVLYGLITTPEDMGKLDESLIEKSSLTEAEVDAASDTFPGSS